MGIVAGRKLFYKNPKKKGDNCICALLISTWTITQKCHEYSLQFHPSTEHGKLYKQILINRDFNIHFYSRMAKNLWQIKIKIKWYPKNTMRKNRHDTKQSFKIFQKKCWKCRDLNEVIQCQVAVFWVSCFFQNLAQDFLINQRTVTKLHKFMSTYTYTNTAQLKRCVWKKIKKKDFYWLLFNGNKMFIYR